MESFGHKMFISSQPYWSLKTTKNLLNKSCYGICAYEGKSVKTTKYGIIWSQNIHFVTTVPLTRTGVLYPRMRDFL